MKRITRTQFFEAFALQHTVAPWSSIVIDTSFAIALADRLGLTDCKHEATFSDGAGPSLCVTCGERVLLIERGPPHAGATNA